MGNQQALTNYNYYSFAENDSDSGFGELSSSPFEYTNVNTTFDYLYETDKTNKAKSRTSKPSHYVDKHQTNEPTLTDDEVFDRGPSTLRIPKSKSFGINILHKPGSFDLDDDDHDLDDSLRNTVKPPLISSSWSPNSSILTNQNKVQNKKSIEKRVTSTPKAIPKSEANLNLTPTPTPTATTNTPTKNATTYPLSFFPGMNLVGRAARVVKDLYNEINPATLTGAIDVVVVQQEDGSFKCSPFHVRFGKLGVIRSKEKLVEIEINGQRVDDLHMVLGEAGEAFFVEKVITDEENNEYVTTCDLANVTVSELSALIAASSTPIISPTVSLKSAESTTTIATISTSPSSTTATLKTTETSEKSLTVKMPLSTSVSSVDLKEANDSEKTLVKSSETTPVQQKSMPIAISGSKASDSTASSSPPLTLNTETSALSPSIIVSPDATDKPTDSATNQTIKANFFSDGELTPELTSPAVSRPPTPKSDTELEVYTKMKRTNTSSDILNQWNWQWGELPSRQQNHKNSVKFSEPELADSAKQQPQQAQILKAPTSETPTAKSPSKILGMFNLMSSKSETKDGGIYLDETEKLDSEVAALYLDQKSNSQKFVSNQVVASKASAQPGNKDDDQESGSGQSLPQSPIRDLYSIIGDVQLSLCGFIFNTSDSTTQSLVTEPINFQQIVESPHFEELFQQYAVSYEKFSDEYASITTNPNLILRINSKYMTWQSAAPVILSAVVFQKNISNETTSALLVSDLSKAIKQPASQEPQQVQQPQPRSTSFLGKFWGGKSKSQPTEQTTPSQPATLTTINAIQKQTTTTTTTTTVTTTVQTNISSSTVESAVPTDNEYGMVFNSDPATDQPSEMNSAEINLDNQVDLKPKEQVRYRKTTRLSSELIERLNLQPGSNEIQYSVTTALQGTTRITSYIFLWNYDDKVIVSDIDGTITKSDVWGQVLPIFGRDWTQAGVADLFSAIERNHYKFMYLSARAIGQSKITRDLLRNINQDGLTLPEGPLLVTPTSLFQAFHKEVIEKKPEEFKISCLKDIQSLFPNHNPYHAGYGNKATDVKAYKTVGIPESRIFTINPQGEVKHEVSSAFQSSYSKLCDYVDLIFPSFKAPLEIKAEYDSFNYWRDPLPMSYTDEIEKELVEQTLREAKENAKDAKKDSKQLNKLRAQASGPAALSKMSSSNSIAKLN